MIFQLLYRIGHYFSLKLPLKITYRIAAFLADIHYSLYTKERRAVIENIKIILGPSAPRESRELKIIAKDVFRNFAKYLVDFFRFSKIDSEYIKKFVKLEGLSNIDEALKRGKGVIILSAHMGNWELGGHVFGKLGYPISAVVLTHQDEKINEFFINQRALSNFRSIEIGPSLRSCYNVLKNNELLALLGDRNFSGKGVSMDFFGRRAIMPKGPAVLCVRTGAAIVCGFMIRQNDDTFKIVFERPIYPEAAADEEESVGKVMRQYLSSVERSVRQYPDQWYVFKYFWGNNDKNLRTDTII
ncbi:MAG: hypothetical protein A3I73_00690 [Omnitrophica bacterium RIFCSPLOWO2_02_FULL_45_16]|nr:MAG: hypothetical protein A3C51_02130 [Omnitrophica bacterium RIFCSPHIGHO2_02_FULL_46_20]OGX00696.1 MAG: hypothetical protein A3I73_00690 [Omnitrophica bacterium RIFCSPLOWO2_02_FULL_45_16]